MVGVGEVWGASVAGTQCFHRTPQRFHICDLSCSCSCAVGVGLGRVEQV